MNAAIEGREAEEVDIIMYVRATQRQKALEHMFDRRDVREEMLPLPSHPMMVLPVGSDRMHGRPQQPRVWMRSAQNQLTTPIVWGRSKPGHHEMVFLTSFPFSRAFGIYHSCEEFSREAPYGCGDCQGRHKISLVSKHGQSVLHLEHPARRQKQRDDKHPTCSRIAEVQGFCEKGPALQQQFSELSKRRSPICPKL